MNVYDQLLFFYVFCFRAKNPKGQKNGHTTKQADSGVTTNQLSIVDSVLLVHRLATQR